MRAIGFFSFKFRFLLCCFFVFTNLSCSLNPLEGMNQQLKVRILSLEANQINRATKSEIPRQFQSNSVPATTPQSAGDYDCIAFNVTGYGIDTKQFGTTEIPLEYFQFGAETPMVAPESSSNLTFNVDVPILMGFNPNLRKRLIQVYGIFTSNADKSICVGKNLSDFLLKTDPYAAVYLIGSGSYPHDASSCSESEICIIDETIGNGVRVELIAQYLQDKDPKYFAFAKVFSGYNSAFQFNNNDLNSGPSAINMSGAPKISKGLLNTQYARIDLYFEVSDYYKKRIANENVILQLEDLVAKKYDNNSGVCSFDAVIPSVFSANTIKYWNPVSSSWDAPPRKAGDNNSNVTPASDYSSSPYSLNGLDMSQINSLMLDGKEYLVFSVRTNEVDCVELLLRRASRLEVAF